MKRTPLRRKGKFKAHSNETKTYRLKRTPSQIQAYAVECRAKRLADPTAAELAFADILGTWGEYFEREHIIYYADRFLILDFYLPASKLAVECDGSAHRTTKKYDAERDEFLESLGIKTIRFTNSEVLKTPELCLQKVTDEHHNRASLS